MTKHTQKGRREAKQNKENQEKQQHDYFKSNTVLNATGRELTTNDITGITRYINSEKKDYKI